MSGAAANVEKKVVKKPNHDAWKACMCGLLQLSSLSSVALCSASTWQLNARPRMSFGAAVPSFASREAPLLIVLRCRPGRRLGENQRAAPSLLPPIFGSGNSPRPGSRGFSTLL